MASSSAGQYQVKYAYHDTYTLVSRYTLGIATQPNKYVLFNGTQCNGKESSKSFKRSLQVVM